MCTKSQCGVLLLLLCGAACAAGAEVWQEPIVANPNRPTVADPADITQRGVVEIEYGFSVARHEQSLAGLLKFAFTRDLELRIDTATYQRSLQAQSGMPAREVGDTGFGIQWRMVRQTRRLPSIAFSYSLKVPTAPDTIGSGAFDHQVKALVSRDIGKSHLDANLAYFFLGRANAPGFDHTFLTAIAWSHPLKGKWGVTAESYGFTHQDANTRGSVSLLAAATYQLRPRLVLDSGLDFGLSGPVPRAAFLVGVTYSIIDLYHPARR